MAVFGQSERKRRGGKVRSRRKSGRGEESVLSKGIQQTGGST